MLNRCVVFRACLLCSISIESVLIGTQSVLSRCVLSRSPICSIGSFSIVLSQPVRCVCLLPSAWFSLLMCLSSLSLKSQFLLSGSAGDGQWIVPITLCCSSYDSCQNFLLKSKSKSTDIGESAWIKVNVDQTGFYRVKYDEELEAKLRPAIENNQLTPTDRFGVLDDTFALCTAGQLPLSSLLTLMHSYAREVDYTVISNLIDISYKVSRIVYDAAPHIIANVKQFFTILLQYPTAKLGWEPKEGESHLDAMLRGELLTALANLGDESTIDEASKRFNAFLDDINSPLLPPDVRKASYVAVMRKVTKSNRSGYEALLRVYRETELSQEKGCILGSLASCPDPEIVLEVLNFLLSSEVN